MTLLANTSASGGMRSKFLRGFNLVSFFLLIALCSGTEILGDDTDTIDPPIMVSSSDEPTIVTCAWTMATHGKLNDPVKLPLLEWTRLHNFSEMKSTHPAGRLKERRNFFVDTRDYSITPDHLVETYRRGGKLYQHFDRIDTETGTVETHRWEFPAFRGVNEMSKVYETLSHVALVGKMYKTIYPHRLPHATKKNEKVPDGTRPAYEIRFNFEPDTLISHCANSERIAQNTTTKEKHRDQDGHALLTTATWLSPTVQTTLREMVRQGTGYTVGVYTTADHPREISEGTKGGKLVAGAIGIVVDGVYTGISLFMDRSHVPDKKNDLYYDGAGRVAFFAELDYLESLGVPWVDSVTVNQAARDFGGRFVTREVFSGMIDEAHAKQIPFVLPADGKWNLRFDHWSKPRQGQ